MRLKPAPAPDLDFQGMTALPNIENRSAPPACRRVPPRARFSDPTQDAASLLSVFTLVLWVGVVFVSVVGPTYPYARPQPSAPTPPPLQAEIISVELTKEPSALIPTAPRPPDASQPPPLPDHLQPLPPAPGRTAVAEPTPAIAFPIPVEGPVSIVDPKRAAYVQPDTPAPVEPVPALPVQVITYGRGEGRQPAPDYPPQAVREGQEGSVTVRFSVGENGRVVAAEALKPSPWPLLNNAALRVVRERWRFRTGAVRLCEVSIRFELSK